MQWLPLPPSSRWHGCRQGRGVRQLGRTEKAETAYLTASGNVPIADYHLARLKLEQGDVDKSLELLGRAVHRSAGRGEASGSGRAGCLAGGAGECAIPGTHGAAGSDPRSLTQQGRRGTKCSHVDCRSF